MQASRNRQFHACIGRRLIRSSISLQARFRALCSARPGTLTARGAPTSRLERCLQSSDSVSSPCPSSEARRTTVGVRSGRTPNKPSDSSPPNRPESTTDRDTHPVPDSQRRSFVPRPSRSSLRAEEIADPSTECCWRDRRSSNRSPDTLGFHTPHRVPTRGACPRWTLQLPA